MAICHFTHFRAFLRRSTYQVLISPFFPVFFIRLLSLMLCGRSVYVSQFPLLFLGYSEPSGWYFVESIIFNHSGKIEVGLQLEPDVIEYYSLLEIEIKKIR